jgi:SAM-dependent methyltransferase
VHSDVLKWVAYALDRADADVGGDVIEMGSRDWNGTPRGLFPEARYTGVDRQAGPAVDIVADCTDLRGQLPDGSFDVALCLEVMEHISTSDKAAILAEMRRLLRPGGVGIVTAGAPGRREHDGGTEIYENLDPYWLVAQLSRLREWGIETGPNEAGGPDVRAWWRSWRIRRGAKIAGSRLK